MKPVSSIRSSAILAAALLLPMGIPTLSAHHPTPRLPFSAAEHSAAVRNAEQNAVRLVEAIVQIESNGDPRKVGRHGERGLMQIKAGTWRDMTVRLFGKPISFDRAFEPALNRRVGTAYLAYLQERLLPRQTEWKTDERSLLLAAYNAGPGRLQRSGFDLDRMPPQTRDYVDRAAALHDAYLADVASAVRPRLLAPL
ncbi:MAG: lytic transglycosylase domain-containing protein [Kiritimatiellia bacterium]